MSTGILSGSPRWKYLHCYSLSVPCPIPDVCILQGYYSWVVGTDAPSWDFSCWQFFDLNERWQLHLHWLPMYKNKAKISWDTYWNLILVTSVGARVGVDWTNVHKHQMTNSWVTAASHQGVIWMFRLSCQPSILTVDETNRGDTAEVWG